MHLALILVFAAVAAALAGLLFGAMWALLFGGRVLYLLHRRFPDTWRAMNFRMSAFSPLYSTTFSRWLAAGSYETINDPRLVWAARRLRDPRPTIAVMIIVGVAAVLKGTQ